MPDLDQRRAAFAWDRVEDAAKKLGGDDGKKAKAYESYKNLAKAAPALVMNNGLMQTLAFFASKDKPHHQQLKADILEWLGRQMDLPTEYERMMKELFEAESERYRLATEETMHLLRWLRQFADS